MAHRQKQFAVLLHALAELQHSLENDGDGDGDGAGDGNGAAMDTAAE